MLLDSDKMLAQRDCFSDDFESRCLNIIVNDNKSIHMANSFSRYSCGFEEPDQPGILFFKESNRMSKRELLLLHFALANIAEEDQIFRPIVISLRELCKSLHVTLGGNNDYKGWYQAIFSLSRRRLVCLQSGRFVMSSPYFSTCAIDLKTKQVMLKLNSDLSQYFLNIYKNKTVFKFGYYRQLNSTHSMDFYRLCSSMKNGNRPFLTSIEYLKMKSGSGQDTKHFLSDVLIPAIYEINAVTDLSIQIQYVRTGRQITDVRFFVREKTAAEQEEMGISVEADGARAKIRVNSSVMRDSVLIKGKLKRVLPRDIVLSEAP